MNYFALIGIGALLLGSAQAKDEAPAEPAATEKKAPKKGRIKFEGGDGSSIEKAIIITGTEDTGKGVKAEYDYLDRKFRRYERLSQGLLDKDGKYYDVFTLKDPKGKQIEVYFDITAFFGKFDDDLLKD